MKKKGNKVIPISFVDCDNRNIEALFKKEKRHGLVGLFVFGIGLIVFIFVFATHVGVRHEDKYYQKLIDGCGESSCCYSSAMYMSDNGYREMEKNKGCPKGSIQRELRCKGSLVWCAGD